MHEIIPPSAFGTQSGGPVRRMVVCAQLGGGGHVHLEQAEPEQAPELGQLVWNVSPNDVPQNVVVKAQVSVGHAIPGSHDAPPFNLRVSVTHISRNVRRSFSDQFDVAQRGVVSEVIGNERTLIQPRRIGLDLLPELNHVLDVQTPTPTLFAIITHPRPRAPHRDGTPNATPYELPDPHGGLAGLRCRIALQSTTSM